MHCHTQHQFYSLASKALDLLLPMSTGWSHGFRSWQNMLLGNDGTQQTLTSPVGYSCGFSGWPSKNGSPSPCLAPRLPFPVLILAQPRPETGV